MPSTIRQALVDNPAGNRSSRQAAEVAICSGEEAQTESAGGDLHVIEGGAVVIGKGDIRTVGRAAAVDRTDRLGSIDVGKQGDPVVLEFPPCRFIPYHLGVSMVETVVKNGMTAHDMKKGGIFVR